MPKTTGSAESATQSAAISPISFRPERAVDAGQRSLLAAARLHSLLIRNALEVNAELLDFARRRVGEDINATETLTRSRNAADAVEVMGEFYKKAFKEYSDEAEKIVKIGNDAALRSIEETQEETTEVMCRGSEKLALPE